MKLKEKLQNHFNLMEIKLIKISKGLDLDCISVKKL